MPADGDLAPVVSLDTVRARRRPRVRTTRIPAEADLHTLRRLAMDAFESMKGWVM